MKSNVNFEQLHEAYTSNVLSVKMIEPLAEQLGRSVDSLMRLGVGCPPGDPSYTFPIRDGAGKVIGLSRRYENGSKYLVTGSKQGLFFEPTDLENRNHGKAKQRFIRVQQAGVSCPICEKPDWCLVSIDDPSNPSAVLCGRVSDGAVREIEDSGFLHVLRKEGEMDNSGDGILHDKGDYVLVVEGASDTSAGMDLGFVTVGRTNALCGIKELPKLLRGRKVIVVGDNDSDSAREVGQKGMAKVAATLEKPCEEVIMILPPPQYKDLREWVAATNLAKEEFMDWVKLQGATEEGSALLGSDIAYEIAKYWLNTYRIIDKLPDIRFFRGQWMRYTEGHYEDITPESVRGDVYEYLDSKMFLNEAGVAVPYKVTRAKVTDITDALQGLCNIDEEAPCWLEDRGLPDIHLLIAFRNGILDLNEYMQGRIKMYDPTPALFSYNILPYNFDEDAYSQIWEDFVDDIFNRDDNKFELLAQWFGYNCVPDMSYEKLMLFTGRPRSGKGTVLNTMIHMLGKSQCVGTSFQNLTSEFGYQPLVGKLAAIMGDAKVSKRNEAGKALEKILQIVGGDPVGIRKMYKGSLGETHLTCRFTVAMNDIPNLPDQANALEPRLNVLKFVNTYMGREDRGLKRRLQIEAQEGRLINFALDGLKSLHTAGRFTEPEDSIEIIRETKELTQPVSAFIDECCELMPLGGDENEYHVSKDMLFLAWDKWCDNSGRNSGNAALFGRWMIQACPLIDSQRIMIGTRRHWVYRKIKLADWAKKELLI